jgi:hypothetical protein
MNSHFWYMLKTDRMTHATFIGLIIGGIIAWFLS